MIVAIGLSGAAEKASTPQGHPKPLAQSPPQGSKPTAGRQVIAAEEEALSVGREANRIAGEANQIAKEQSGLNAWQVLLTGLAAGAAIAAALYARSAAADTKRSADVAHDALKDARAGAVAQSDLFKQQLHIAKDSVDAARAATIAAGRAWLSIETELSGPLIFVDDQVRVDIDCTLHNIGRSPAAKVIWDWGIFGSPGDAHERISKNTRDRYLSVVSMGRVVFPSQEVRASFSLTMKRTEFIACCDRLPEDGDDGRSATFPSVVVGVQYALPGEGKRRYTYTSYYIRRKGTGFYDFDGSEGRFEMAEIELIDDQMTGPIT